MRYLRSRFRAVAVRTYIAQFLLEDFSKMKDDRLSTKEPVFAVRPRACSRCGKSTSRRNPPLEVRGELHAF